MDTTEEREILRSMRALAEQYERWSSAGLAAIKEKNFAEADAASKHAECARLQLGKLFEEVYRVHHPKLARMAKHLARRDQDAEDIEQLAWTRYYGYLDKVNPEVPAFALLARCLRTAAWDYYRVAANIDMPIGAENYPELQATKTSPFVGDYAEYSALLHMALGRDGGPVHERITFGLIRLLSMPPRHLVQNHSGKTLASLAQLLRHQYSVDSSLPPQVVNSAFRELQVDLARRLDELDRATARKYEGTALPTKKIGDGKLRDYYGKGQPEETVSRWTGNVLRRLRKLPAEKVADSRTRNEDRS